VSSLILILRGDIRKEESKKEIRIYIYIYKRRGRNKYSRVEESRKNIKEKLFILQRVCQL